MSIQNEINRISGAKNSIKSEIEKLGISIPNDAKLDSYSNYISNYVLDFQSRLSALEAKAKQAVYFKNTVSNLSSDASVEEKISNLEEKSKVQIYIKE